MNAFAPDYRKTLAAAMNRRQRYIPIYEHQIAVEVMEDVLGRPFAQLIRGDDRDLDEFFRCYCGFFKKANYDTVSYECCTRDIFPGGGALTDSSHPAIKGWDDFNAYPFNELEDLYFRTFGRNFEALKRNMSAGMKAVGGVGNGVLECAEDLVGYQNLCYLRYDEPELFREIFDRVGNLLFNLWDRFLPLYGDAYCIPRMGDDMGFQSSTLLPHEDIRKYMVPHYRRIAARIHAENKPFLMHSCGNIFPVMEDLIEEVGIDAKHSNEDSIAPFPVWIDRYGERIALFGGIDTDVVCRGDEYAVRNYIEELIAKCAGRCGWAFGTGNSIPVFISADRFLTMIRVFCELRDKR